MGSNWIVVAAAAVTGVFVLISALLSFSASRGEPRPAKELLALNEILKDMPPSAGRHALATRREAIALKYGKSGVEIFSDLERSFLMGGVFLIAGVVLASVATGNVVPTLSALASGVGVTLFAGGAVIVLTVVIAAVWRVIRWWKTRKGDR
ncbi:conserved membrane hypothetical protein [Microbacterium sp. 8M]|uniref:hypothetical protein n=1 Tax=Microbacterium sp. 8M TaxID=2653153 RepID=UPI0012EFB07E|nr:hypothetical protein [Microbacterium sp. 8M]VXB54145.1 conserved membrane hypothetical protein [Microbacterium sp. 8M]